MTFKNPIFRRRARIVLVQVLFVFLALEILLRIAFYQQTGYEKIAVLEYMKKVRNNYFPRKASVDYRNHYLVRPDSTKEVNQKIADECLLSNRFEYSPGADYRQKDYTGNFVNIIGFERKTIPSEYTNPVSSLPSLVIRFMGGSTLFGLNSTDAETIPSAFVRLYKKKYADGRSIKVINNGICGYHSYNELTLFSRFCFTGAKTDVVVFLDGLNDMIMTRSVQERLSYSYYRLLLSNRTTSVSAKEISRITDSTFRLYETPRSLKGKNIADTLIQRYFENMHNIVGVAAMNKCNAYFFVQPNPFFNYPNRKNDPICMQDEKPVIFEAYQKLERRADSTKNFFFLGNMLEKERGYPFVDLVHYSPHMSEKIASSILDRIGPAINKGVNQ